MPNAPKRPCNTPGCRELVSKGRCAKHAKTRAQQYEQQRGNFRQRGYVSGNWEALRAECLKRYPLCKLRVMPKCKAEAQPSTFAHHVIPKREGGSDDLSNLAGVCRSCHSSVTATYEGGFGNARKDREGQGGC